MSGLLDGKRALVFSCGDGIGEAVATRFREEGGQTLVASEQGDLAHGGTPAGVARVFEAASAQLGGIDTVVNAVTRWWVGFPEDATDEVIADLFRWNVATASAVAQGVLRHIPGSGSLLSISHVWATGTSPELGVAGASKAALGPLTKAVAQRGAARRLRANLLLVGVVDTPSLRDLAAERLRVLGIEGDPWARVTSRVAMGRAAQPDEVAKAAAFLASDHSRLITGATVLCDGGLLYA